MTTKLADDFLRPFNTAKVMEMHSTALHIQKFGLSIDDVIDLCEICITKRIAEAEQDGPLLEPSETTGPGEGALGQDSGTLNKCPECGSPVRISMVNVSKCTAVGGDWKTSLECSNKDCRFTELSTKSIAEWRLK